MWEKKLAKDLQVQVKQKDRIIHNLENEIRHLQNIIHKLQEEKEKNLVSASD